MATMHITPMHMPSGGHLERFGVRGRQDATVQVAFSATVGNSDAFAEGTLVSLFPDADCWIRIGASATAAVNTGEPLDAATGEGYMRYVAAGERVSVIAR